MPNAASINKQLELYIASLEEKLREKDATIKEQLTSLENIGTIAMEKEDAHSRFCDYLIEQARENEEKLIEGHKRQQQRMKEELEEEHRREIKRLNLEHKMKMSKMENEMELMMSMANKVCDKYEEDNELEITGLGHSVSPREDKSESYVSRYEDGTQMVSVSPR